MWKICFRKDNSFSIWCSSFNGAPRQTRVSEVPYMTINNITWLLNDFITGIHSLSLYRLLIRLNNNCNSYDESALEKQSAGCQLGEKFESAYGKSRVCFIHRGTDTNTRIQTGRKKGIKQSAHRSCEIGGAGWCSPQMSACVCSGIVGFTF